MAQHVNPADIPAPGRYDFSVVKCGVMGRTTKHAALSAVMDNGPYAGKRLNFPAPDHLANVPKGTRFSARVTPEASAFIDGEWQTVPLDYRESNPRIRYRVDDFGTASAPRSANLKAPRTKFPRRK
jgi:hypothetical protein